MKLVVGLGNPGDKYAQTRHNLGFMALDEYAKKNLGPEIVWNPEKKLNTEVIRLNDLMLVKPQTYMNNSGMAVTKILNYFRLKPEDLIIIHDDLDLPLGKIKVRLGGAAAGHHGVESIINYLKTDQFIRVRLGIGNLRTKSAEHGGEHVNVEHFVLSSFPSKEKSSVKKMLKQAILALNILLKDGLEKAQNQFN